MRDPQKRCRSEEGGRSGLLCRANFWVMLLGYRTATSEQGALTWICSTLRHITLQSPGHARTGERTCIALNLRNQPSARCNGATLLQPDGLWSLYIQPAIVA